MIAQILQKLELPQTFFKKIQNYIERLEKIINHYQSIPHRLSPEKSYTGKKLVNFAAIFFFSSIKNDYQSFLLDYQSVKKSAKN